MKNPILKIDGDCITLDLFYAAVSNTQTAFEISETAKIKMKKAFSSSNQTGPKPCRKLKNKINLFFWMLIQVGAALAEC